MKGQRIIPDNQKGMASFMVTAVLILVISLIIIGFSQAARRNQRETLDRQLSTQAFFAAESGVNGAVSIIKNKISAGELPPVKTDCNDYSNYPNMTLDGNDVRITCMLVSTEIDTLYYMGVGETSPTVVPLVSANGAAIERVTLTWRNPSGGATASQGCAAGNGFTTKDAWNCGNAVLRTDLSPFPGGNTAEIAMSTFFYPNRTVAPINDVTAPNVPSSTGGGLVTAACSDADNDPKCMATISGLSGSTYYMTLRSIYNDSSVTISARDVNGTEVRFTGQVLIDVTAKAQDVLRRIQVRVPLERRESSTLPGYAIESSGSLCKRFAVEPGYYNVDTSVCN